MAQRRDSNPRGFAPKLISSIDVHGINRIRNFGRISANEVAKKLSELGMENSEWNKFIIKED